MTSPSTDALFEAMNPPPPLRLGWWLLSWPAFQAQFDGLVDAVKRLREKDPEEYRRHPKTKLLATIVRLITEDIPRDPGHSNFRQGGTLGTEYTSWFRAKFHSRFRLFYRFDSQRKAIVYAWMNDESGMRKESDRNDPYHVFRRMLERGKPPTSFDDLLRKSSGLTLPPD
jgi:toxin YhaV